MSRRTEPMWKTDARLFGVRVRFLIPEGGLSITPELNAWLHREAGDQHAIHSAGTWPQSSFLYLNDVTLAARAVTDFGLRIHGLPKAPLHHWQQSR